MTTPNKFAVLLKPTDEQPALDRAAQYSRVDPSISVVAVRVVNNYKEENVEQITLKEKANFEMLKRKYASIKNFDFKVVFDKNGFPSYVPFGIDLSYFYEKGLMERPIRRKR